MADTPGATLEGSTILTTPPVTPATPEGTLFPTTPSGTPETPPATPPPAAPATPPATPPVTPPAAPSEPPKPPTEPPKPEVPATPPAAPTEYVLSLPEGSPLTKEDLDATQKQAKESGLTEDKAKELLQSKDQTARAAQTRLQEQQQKAFEQTKVEWKESVAKDPEMGGEKLAETVTLARRAFQKLASPELQVWAERTGLGSYPEFVRLMSRVGRLIGEDQLLRGSVNEPAAPRPREEVLFGKTTPGADGKIKS